MRASIDVNAKSRARPAIALLALLSTQAVAMADDGNPEGRPGARRAGLHAGALFAGILPFGGWTDHPYAGQRAGTIDYPEGLDLFGSGLGGAIELGWKHTGPYGLILQIETTSLGTGEWEEAAAAHGSHITADASQVSGHLLFRFELWAAGAGQVELRGGLGFMYARGRETFHDVSTSYDYDFLEPTPSLRAGLGAGVELFSGFDVCLALDATLGLSGVERATGSDEPYLALTLFVGPRVWFDSLLGP